jgi:hypothetical protein
MKKQLGLRVEATLKDGLKEQAERAGKAETTLLEEYIAAGLARDAGELIEHNSLPAIREAVREEVARSMQEVYQQLSTELQRSARRSDDRLAALIVKAIRGAGIGWRLVFALLAKQSTYDTAFKAYEDAREKAGKELARTIDQE